MKFSAPMAHLITAGADFIVVPSRFEPCGLIREFWLRHRLLEVCKKKI